MIGIRVVSFILNIFKLIEWTIVIRVILSFVQVSRSNALVDAIYSITDYIMYPAQKLLDTLGLNKSFIDWSPLVTLLGLQILATIIVGLI